MTKKDDLTLTAIELLTRRDLAGLLKMGISSIDLIPEDELPRVRLGRSVRFTLQSVHDFIRKHENYTRGKDKC